MRLIVTKIEHLPSKDNVQNYEVEVVADGQRIRFTITLLADGDMTWDTAFDQFFLRCHVNIGIKVMDLVGDFHKGQLLCLPQEFSD